MPFINGGHIWLVLILLAVLVIFGPSKLPELGGAVGRTIKEFRRSTTELKDEMTRNHDEPAAASVAQTTPVAQATPVIQPKTETVGEPQV